MAVKPRAEPALVVEERAARVHAGVGVDASLEPERVDFVRDLLHSVREALLDYAELPVLVVAAEEPVVDVDVEVASLLEPVRGHGLRGLDDDVLGDFYPERVPARPAEERTLDARVGKRLREREEFLGPCRARLLRGAVETAQVDVRGLRVGRDADALVALGAFAEFDPREAVENHDSDGGRGRTLGQKNVCCFHVGYHISISFACRMPSSKSGILNFMPL